MAFTLTLVFDENDRVLMCNHAKLNCCNFIGGKIDEMEQPLDAAYRELEEETGITRDDVELRTIRFESVSTVITPRMKFPVCDLYVTCGRLKHPVTLKQEKNKLFWFKLSEDNLKTFIQETYGYGNCLTYYWLAIEYLRCL